MIRSQANLNPPHPTTVAVAVAVAAGRVGGHLLPRTPVANTRFPTHYSSVPPRYQRLQRAVSTSDIHLAKSMMDIRHHQLHHHHHQSLELALEEADGGFYAEQQLRRANVSPFFTSCRAPSSSQDSEMPELELLPSPRAAPRRTLHHQVHQPRDLQRLVIPPPLSLDGYGDGYLSDHDKEGDSDIATTSLCWQEMVPFPENIAMPPSQQLQPQHTHSSESADAWDLFLNESYNHSSSHGTNSSGRLDFANALKTPTAESVASFTGYFPYAVSKDDDPTALSPTHMDKKVLVTEHDLKLPSSSSYSGGKSSGDWNNPRHSYVYAAAHHKRAARVWREELLSAQEATLSKMRRRVSSSSSRAHPYSPVLSSVTHASQPSRRKNRSSAATTSHGNWPFDEPATPRVPALHRPVEMPCAPQLTTAIPTRCQWKASPTTSSSRQHALRDGELRTPRRQDYQFPYTINGQPRAKASSRNSSNSNSHNHSNSNKTHKPTKRKIGIYTPEARRERLRRFHEKRKQRVFRKRIKYDCRKRLANACPRIKGRFVRKQPKVDESSTTMSPCPPSEEDCSGTSVSGSSSSDQASALVL